MSSALERAAKAAWDEIARQNGENTSGYAGTYAGRPNYVEGFIDTSALARAALMALRGLDEDNESDAGVLIKGRAVMPEHDEPLLEDAAETFTAMIDAILNEKDTTNDHDH